jgi:two-component system OmpR family response regulator
VKPPLEKILLVEDDPDIRTIVKAALEMMGGFQVKACAAGAEALDAVAGFAPQLALLDVMMPDMDGPGVLAKLRELPQTTGMPVIFLTAKTAASEIQRLRALGAAGVLMKPFDPMALPQQVKDIWEKTNEG